ncbi:hypothetical protein BJ166DRAFT_366538 [Pestalotiopsis sp. NC0098]|nr:hypothetical protein BJ166DRAFT_366538 [Pestalotiopsis sp. NC0098]
MDAPDIVRDDWVYQGGILFYAKVGPCEIPRVESSDLRKEFLPKMTSEGERRIARWSKSGAPDSFVRAQLKHYGVQFDESDLSGNGVDLLTKVLEDGKCDSVPQHISDLREEMHQAYIEQLSEERLRLRPEWLIEKYFLTKGKPDRAKTETVVDVPCGRWDFEMRKACEAAAKIEGLHCAKGDGPRHKNVFLGWDEAAVKKAAEDHIAADKAKEDAKEAEREQESIRSHWRYHLAIEKPERIAQGFSPVGKYDIDCKDIEESWPDDVKKMSMNIHATKMPSVFKAQFDFGILEGVMIMSRDLPALLKYCKIPPQADESEDEEWEEEEEEAKEATGANTGDKRKAASPTGPRKEAKTDTVESNPLKYHVRLRCRDKAEMDNCPSPCKGTITFADDKFTRFSGEATLPGIAVDVPFKGYKSADKPVNKRLEWETFSWEAWSQQSNVITVGW